MRASRNSGWTSTRSDFAEPGISRDLARLLGALMLKGHMGPNLAIFRGEECRELLPRALGAQLRTPPSKSGSGEFWVSSAKHIDFLRSLFLKLWEDPGSLPYWFRAEIICSISRRQGLILIPEFRLHLPGKDDVQSHELVAKILRSMGISYQLLRRNGVSMFTWNPPPKQLVVDMDGVITDCVRCPNPCTESDPEHLRREKISRCPVTPMAAESIAALRSLGYRITIHTSRKDDPRVIREWLERNGIQCDEIIQGKPWGLVYVDDRALRFCSWEQILKHLA